jgi:hypothetical protein
MFREHVVSNGLGGELGGHLLPQRTDSDKSMEIDQLSAIKFFADERMQGVNIIKHLNGNYGHDTLSRNRIDYWLAEMKRGRTDLSNITSPGRRSDDELRSIIPRRYKQYPRM